MATVTREPSRATPPPPAPKSGERVAATVILDNTSVHVPGWVTDLDAFRRWLDTDAVPEKAKTWFLRGEVWVDMSKEQLYTHLLLKGEFYRVLGNLVKDGKLGWLYPDGLLLTNTAADLSGNPDATFVSEATVTAGRAVEVAGKQAGFVEIVGTPDMVLEVVSNGSVEKDTITLFEDYYTAGVGEYWLVDARGAKTSFVIHVRGEAGYAQAAGEDGWQPSAVFGKALRLTRHVNARGNPEFTLEVR